MIGLSHMLIERCRYDDVRSLYVDQLAFTWLENSTTETTRASVDKKIDSFVEGDLEHVTEMLSALWEIVNKDGDVKAPTNTPPTVSPLRFRLLLHVIWECSLHVIRPHRLHRPRVLLTGPL